MAKLARFSRWTTPLLHRYWLLSRGMTLGVRCAIFDGDGRVFLVKHTYTPGWHMPGGGVEPGETALQALMREVHEEANIELESEARLFGLYFNSKVTRRDHVALFVAADWHQSQAPTPDAEIADHGFFAQQEVPRDTTPATRRRLEEIAGTRERSPHW